MFNTHYLIKVPKAPDPAWHTTSTELGSTPHAPGKTPLGNEAFPLERIRKRSFGLFLVTDCGGLAVSPRRFHIPIRSLPHSRERPSISSSLTFEGHIAQSCGADIHSVHSVLTGNWRLILSAAACGIHPSPCMGIDASIASFAFNPSFFGREAKGRTSSSS